MFLTEVPPEVWAGTATVVGAVILKHSEKQMKPKPAAIEPVEEEYTTNDIAPTCFVFEIRDTQQKMVDAGIITAEEMSTCGNPQCEYCKPTYEAVYQRDINEAREMANAKVVEQRDAATVKYGQFFIPRPSQVPDHAVISGVSNRGGDFYNVSWKWLGESGKAIGLQSIFCSKIQAPGFQPPEDNLLKWRPVNDPDTDEHLGDYRIKNGKLEIRNPVEETEIVAGCGCRVKRLADGSRNRTFPCAEHRGTKAENTCYLCGSVDNLQPHDNLLPRRIDNTVHPMAQLLCRVCAKNMAMRPKVPSGKMHRTSKRKVLPNRIGPHQYRQLSAWDKKRYQLRIRKGKRVYVYKWQSNYMGPL